MSTQTFQPAYTELCGVIGGVGPEATELFLKLFRQQTTEFKKEQGIPVTKDQDYLPILVFSNPLIPDRTKNLLENGEDPLPALVYTANALKKAGATFGVIPCNTAHAFIDELEQQSGLPMLNMIRLTADFIRSKYGKTTVGLLATTGTVKTQIYQKHFGNITILTPVEDEQKNVMKAIYDETHGIKCASADNELNFDLLNKEAKKLIDQGAKLIIAGCTEIPIVLTQDKCDFPVIDPMQVLAKEAVSKSLSL